MVTELLNAMRHYKEQHGHDLKVIQLSRSQYNELRLEIRHNLRYNSATNDSGEVEEFNGAAIQVL